MMHPQTRINFISPEVGVGVIAKEFIPKGTLVWVRDPLDRVLEPAEVAALPEPAKDFSLTYMYRNAGGQYVLLWDHGKYVNHDFAPNCMPTPYGFDIAIRDIPAGAELTEDYGLLNIIEEFSPFQEGDLAHRGVVRGDDISRHAAEWDAQMKSAISQINQVAQPLLNLVPPDVLAEIERVVRQRLPARPVLGMLFGG
jgi:hypothetical protein